MAQLKGEKTPMRTMILALLAGFLFCSIGCRTRASKNAAQIRNSWTFDSNQTYYLKHNVFFDVKPIRGKYGANNGNSLVAETPMLVHGEASLLPVGASCRVYVWKDTRQINGFILNAEGNSPVYVVYRVRDATGWRKGSSVWELNTLASSMLSSTPVDVSGSAFCADIRNGQVRAGMSKQDVHLAWGPPMGGVLTISGQAREPYYKYHRQQIEIVFDADGMVTEISDPTAEKGKTSRFCNAVAKD
jgi:hypothetical protein